MYLIVHGGDMHKRAIDHAVASEQAQRACMQDAAASSTSCADEIEKLARLHQQSVLTDNEFQTQKAKVWCDRGITRHAGPDRLSRCRMPRRCKR